MKKIIFTAVGVVAFSGVSMANSSVKFEKNNVIKSTKISYEDCNIWAMNFCEELSGWNDTDSATAYTAYREVVAFCESASQLQFVESAPEFIGIDLVPLERIQP